MATSSLAKIGELLSEVAAPGSFTAKRTAASDDLDLQVKGVGRLRFPISRSQAQKLCRIARPARYGQGEETLLDKQVRDTWEIPKSRVKIDRRQWNRTLVPVLDGLRADLGLAEGPKLRAELHSMLVYAPGQFFLPHQDSEKSDDMVGTLVVMLPSSFKGGAFVVEHRGETVTYRGSKKLLSFIAFYADCQHEVQPVKEGYRVVLTYNLLRKDNGGSAKTPAADPPIAVIDTLVKRLRKHFETPPPPRWDWQEPPQEPPNRLVYLLDHQYTERGLGWHRLKGDDAARAVALQAAAERADCEMVLALADIHETWSCMEEDWYEPWYGRRRHWERDEDDEWYEEDEPPPQGPDRYELVDLIDWGITLERWIDSSGDKATPIVTRVDDSEVCSSTPSSELEPYAAEHEGYMGNYGNTMDRWYRRAALVLWPRERAFAVRAEASPAWALESLKRRIRGDEVSEAREMAVSLLPFWKDVAPHEERRGFFNKALRVAEGLDVPETAASLLKPFPLEALTAREAPALVALVKRYGKGWLRSLLAKWAGPDRPWRRPGGRDRLAWLSSLPRLCDALSATDEAEGAWVARALLEDRWYELQEEIGELHDLEEPPSLRDKELAALAKPLLGFLESTTVAKAGELREETVSLLCADENEMLLPCLVTMLRAATKTETPGLETIQRNCVRRLEARLEPPARDEDDWSIALPPGCDCELCDTLGEFLADPEESRLEWPLAKDGRKHVHRRIDAHELPVRHETRRSGRPYTLVLTKTEALFEREAAQRRSWQADLEWLTAR